MEINTERLIIKDISGDEAKFYLELFNDPDWIKNINDKGLRTVEAVEDYIKNKVLKEFQNNGTGFFTIRLKNSKQPIGVSTLLFRDITQYYDVGYALMPNARGKGYAKEATLAMMEYTKLKLKAPYVYAITKTDNMPSINLLKTIGFDLATTEELFEEGENNYIFRYDFNTKI